MKKLTATLAVLVILFSAVQTVSAQSKMSKPTPTPTPTIFLSYAAIEQTCLDCKDKERFVQVEIEFGSSRAKNKKLLAEIVEAGFPVKSITPYGVFVSYPKEATDCQILADSTEIAEIAVKYFPKNYKLKFNWGIFAESFFQTLPDSSECGKKPPDATPSPPVPRHFYIFQFIYIMNLC